MRMLKDNGRYKVPFEFQSKTVILKVTRYTTFDDVVHMLTHKAGIPNTTARCYAVYECTWDLERKIGGKVRVLTIWKSWGCENNNFRFVVRRSESTAQTSHRYPVEHAEGVIDDLFSESYRRTNKLGLVIETQDSYFTVEPQTSQTNDTTRDTAEERKEIAAGETLYHHRCPPLFKSEFNMENTSSTNQSTTRAPQCNNESGGKMALLAKYLNDMKVFGRRKSRKPSGKLGRRQRADGAETPEVYGGRHVEGAEIPDDPRNPGLISKRVSMATCRYHWQRNSDSDTDSDMSDESFAFSQPESDNDSDGSCTCFLSRESCALDTAFVSGSRFSDSDEGIDVTSMTSGDLNTAFVASFRRKVTSKEEISTIVHSDGEFERNISASDYVRKLFGSEDSQSVGSQDEEVDSFMRSRLDSF